MTERALTRDIRKLVPGMYAIENSIGVGTPDICLPKIFGDWMWVELKWNYSGHIYLKQWQNARIAKESKLLLRFCQPWILIGSRGGDVAWFEQGALLDWPKRPHKNGIQMDIPEDAEWEPLAQALWKKGVYSKIKP